MSIEGPTPDASVTVTIQEIGFRRNWDPIVELTEGTLNEQRIDEPAGDLGPAYTSTIALDSFTRSGRNVTDKITQEVYPLAPEGPVAYIPPGQTRTGFDGAPEQVIDGWVAYPAGMISILERHGFVAKPSEPAREASTGATSGTAVPTWLIAAVTISIGIGGFMVLRRRSVRRKPISGPNAA